MIRRGEVLGLVGESGCSKSTLRRLRLQGAGAGVLRFSGQAVPPALDVRRRAGIVFQNPGTAPNPRQTVSAILRRPLRRFSLPAGNAEVARLLDLVRLPASYAARRPSIRRGPKTGCHPFPTVRTRLHFYIACRSPLTDPPPLPIPAPMPS